MENAIYRRNKFVIGSDWHCNPQCPQWPRGDYLETDFLDPKWGDHVCPDCTHYADKPADKKHRNAA